MGKIIGIDLGTSNSAAAVLEAGRPKLIPSAEGTTVAGKAFPSVVAFTKEGRMLVGEPARRQMVTNPEGTISGVKRKMGTDHKYNVHGKEYTPQQISSFILQKIKTDAEAFLGEKVENAVITVPAYFNDNQRQATKDAGTIAGLDVVRIINEPTAASLAYGIDKGETEQTILVFDFGGGTLDVTVMEFGGGVFEVKSTSGDTRLGGRDMDNTIVDYLVSYFKGETGIDLRGDTVAMTRLRETGEKAKIELSTTLQTQINLPFISADSSGPKHFVYDFTRAKLEELVNPIVERCNGSVERALSDAKISSNDIHRVILVGGPTRMPIVQKFVEKIVGKKAEGGVDPMECVSFGAAIQGGVLSGEVKDLLLLDVTPLSLGIETLGGVMTRLIERNTTIPTKKSQIFSTAADSQPSVDVKVLQGERSMASGNVELGKFQLVGIPPAPKGIPQIEVTFDIDANGILNVSAKDKATGKEQKITIAAPHKLSKEEVERMMDDAKKFEKKDKEAKEQAELMNEAETIVYAAEKMLKDLGEKLNADAKKEIEEKSSELKKALGEKNLEVIRKKNDELKDVMQKAGASMYQGSEGATGTGPGGPGSPGVGGNSGGDPGGENVQDADYTVDDKK
ncbi:MAG: molecular chaperone DnaK [Candidatus Micrarchaeota archaeon]